MAQNPRSPIPASRMPVVGSPHALQRMPSPDNRQAPPLTSAPPRREPGAAHRTHSPLPRHCYPLEVQPHLDRFPTKVRGPGSTTGSLAGSTEGSSSGFTGSTTVPSRLLGSLDESGKQTFSSLQSELKELRSTLEKKKTQHQQLGSLMATKLQGGDEQRIAKHVQQVQQVASAALEQEVKELCATVANQQAEQAIFLQMLMGEIDMLRDQVQAVRDLDHLEAYQNLSTATACQMDELRSIVSNHQQWKLVQEKNALTTQSQLDSLRHDFGILKREQLGASLNPKTSNIDPEMRQLLLAIDERSTQQDVQVSKLNAEVQRMQALAGQKHDNTELADDVDRLVVCIDNLKTHHASLIAAVDSEVQSLKKEVAGREVQSAGASEQALAELRSSISELDRKHKKTDDDSVQAMKRSNDLTMQMQSDMNYLRELLERNGTAQQDFTAHEASLDMTRTLRAEIELLRRKHDEIGVDQLKKDASMTQQAQAELQDLRSSQQAVQQQLKELGSASRTVAEELRTAAHAQKSTVDALNLQIKEQQAQLSALGASSKAVAEVREAETSAMRRTFEQQVLQHAEAIKSLNTQVGDLSDFTKQAMASLQQPPAQPVLDAAVQILGQDNDITKLRTELDALKLQSTMQRSLQATEVAKEAAAIHGQVHKILGNEREARLQESTEMRALIKKLFSEMAQLTQHLKVGTSDNRPSIRGGSSEAGYPTELLEPMEIKRLVTTDLSFGIAPDNGKQQSD